MFLVVICRFLSFFRFTMHYSYWFAATVILGVCSAPLQAMATPVDLQTTPLTMTEALAAERHSATSLNNMAGELGQSVGQQDNPELAESPSIPLIDEVLNNLMDDSGDLRLPMGLRVYGAMGTPSIGFGSRF